MLTLGAVACSSAAPAASAQTTVTVTATPESSPAGTTNAGSTPVTTSQAAGTDSETSETSASDEPITSDGTPAATAEAITSPKATTPTASEESSTPAGPIDALGAADIALAGRQGAVVEIDLGTENGIAVWEVVVRNDNGTGVEVKIDIDNGTVVVEESTELEPEAAQAPAITAQEAIGMAVATVPGRVTDVELGREQGRIVWDIDITDDGGAQRQVYLDATTGEILTTR